MIRQDFQNMKSGNPLIPRAIPDSIPLEILSVENPGAEMSRHALFPTGNFLAELRRTEFFCAPLRDGLRIADSPVRHTNPARTEFSDF
jgi:hypothetical protein